MRLHTFLVLASLTAAAVATEPGFSVGERETLFEVNYILGAGLRNYDVAPDGRFLFVLPLEGRDSERREIHVVLDWFGELERLVPSN